MPCSSAEQLSAWRHYRGMGQEVALRPMTTSSGPSTTICLMHSFKGSIWVKAAQKVGYALVSNVLHRARHGLGESLLAASDRPHLAAGIE